MSERADKKLSTCATCGFKWFRGQSGKHSCTEWLSARIKQLEQEWQREHNVIRLLIAGNFVTEEKVEEARRLLE